MATIDTTRRGEVRITEASRILGISMDQLYRASVAGKIPFRQARPGLARRYDRAALESWARTRPDKVRSM